MLARTAAIVMLLLAGSVPAAAQHDRGGIKAGLCLSQATGPGFESESNVTGPAAGVFFCLGRGPVSAQLELLYSRKGTAEQGQVGIDTAEYFVDVTYRFHYLEFPLLLRWRPAAHAPAIYAGASLGVLVGAAATGRVNDIPVDSDIRSSLNETDAGLLLGAEIRTQAGLCFEARYSRGLLSVLDADEGQGAYNSTISVMMGYHLW
ncbi:MAG: PorT family protein [Candidatus Edwardsbacteria bacterium]|jgi:hypothetical protein|nr:PorT family protein [Candidatus Edwardsbacteria bacterium]